MYRINTLKSGYDRFRQRYFKENRPLFEKLTAEGQSPKIAIVSCCDARVEPSIILDAAPGDLFVIRNVANLVPPYGVDDGYHGTPAALEFAVKGLNIGHIVVMGHSQCGGIRALLHDKTDSLKDYEFLGPWVSITEETRKQVLCDHAGESDAVQQRALEQRSIVSSLTNLRSFPFVKEQEMNGTLTLHGWYFDIESGALLVYDQETDTFSLL